MKWERCDYLLYHTYYTINSPLLSTYVYICTVYTVCEKLSVRGNRVLVAHERAVFEQSMMGARTECEGCVNRVWGVCEQSVRGVWGVCEQSVRVVWTECEGFVIRVWGVCEQSVRGAWTNCEGCVNRVWGVREQTVMGVSKECEGCVNMCVLTLCRVQGSVESVSVLNCALVKYLINRVRIRIVWTVR